MYDLCLCHELFYRAVVRLIVIKTKKGDEYKMEQNEKFLQGSLSITVLQELQICV